MTRNEHSKRFFPKGRVFLVVFFLSTLAMAVVGRAAFLQLKQRSFLQDQGDARVLRVVPIHSHRGVVRDRNGEPLAVSTPVDSVWVNPQEVDMQHEKWPQLMKALGFDAAQMKAKIIANQSREFIYLKRHLQPEIAEKIQSLDVPGVNVQREYRRYYPDGEVISHIVGFTDIDDHGQEGLELAYNDWLQGVPGKKRVLKDRLGREIKMLEVIRPAEPGKDLVLSIDRNIQYLAYRELKAQVAKHEAVGGSAVILDIKTGEVLAMVNQPSFNPNNRERLHDSRYRNRAVTDLFEPGSTIKTFSVANALEQGGAVPETIVNTAPGFMNVGGHVVRDVHNYGTLDLAGILKKSSNIGVTKITLGLPPQSLSGMLSRLGFGSPTGTGFPGESTGTLTFPKQRQEFALATLAFGYGVSTNPLQLAHAYATLANDGKKIPLSFLKTTEPKESEQVIQPEVAHTVLEMLGQVVDSGGGSRAHVPGFRVGGKTGTARKLEGHSYRDDKHLSLFSGVAPLNQPRFVMVVMIDEPHKGEYYGGLVAAPVFSRVMEGVLRIEGIAPDPIAPTEAPTDLHLDDEVKEDA